jgi:hypothetical protein
MTKMSDAAVPSLLITEGTEPAAPAAGKQRLYIDSTTHKLKRTDSSGTDVTIEAAGGSMASDTIWDAAGDLVQGTGADTAAKLSAGTIGYHLRAGGAGTALVWAKYELDYVQITTGVTLTATTEGTAHTVITGTSQTYAAEPIIVECFAPRFTVTGTSGATIVVLLFDGATVLGRMGLFSTPAGAALITGATLQYRLTPTAATHQYIIKAYSTVTASVFDCGGGGTGVELPAFIRVTRAV